jgi:hypothetical protein
MFSGSRSSTNESEQVTYDQVDQGYYDGAYWVLAIMPRRIITVVELSFCVTDNGRQNNIEIVFL